jgi:hypothetical protein
MFQGVLIGLFSRLPMTLCLCGFSSASNYHGAPWRQEMESHKSNFSAEASYSLQRWMQLLKMTA